MQFKAASKIAALVTLAVLVFSGAVWYDRSSDREMVSSVSVPDVTVIKTVNQADSARIVAYPAAPTTENHPRVTADFNNEETQPALAAWKLSGSVDETFDLPEEALKDTAQVVDLDPSFIDQEQLSLNLPNGQVLNLQRKMVENLPTGSKSWVGKDPQRSELYAVITQNGDSVAGSILTQDGTTYLISTLKSGKQVIFQQDEEKLRRMSQHNDQVLIKPTTEADAVMLDYDVHDDSLLNASSPTSANSMANLTTAADDNVSEIQVLFVFNTEAINALGGGDIGLQALQAKVDSEIVVANTQTFPESGVNMRLIPVGPLVANKVMGVIEDSVTGTALDDYLDFIRTNLNVANYRNTYEADLVVGIGKFSSDGCGIAYVSRPSVRQGFAFSVVDFSCIGYSLTHEIGHNMGLAHNIEVDPSVGNNHGLLQCQPGGFATQLSYLSCSVGRIKRFSNPNVSYNGFPTGVVGVSENAQNLEISRTIVADFRAPSVMTSPTATPTATPTKTPTATPTKTPIVTPTASPTVVPTVVPVEPNAQIGSEQGANASEQTTSGSSTLEALITLMAIAYYRRRKIS